MQQALVGPGKKHGAGDIASHDSGVTPTGLRQDTPAAWEGPDDARGAERHLGYGVQRAAHGDALCWAHAGVSALSSRSSFRIKERPAPS